MSLTVMMAHGPIYPEFGTSVITVTCREVCQWECRGRHNLWHPKHQSSCCVFMGFAHFAPSIVRLTPLKLPILGVSRMG